MKKHFKPLTLLMSFLLIFTLLSGCGNGGEAALVLTNGVVYTVDGDNWQNEPAEAVAVDANGIILFVGSAAEAYIGDDAKVIDLDGKVVFPGFIDSHCHAPGFMLTKLFEIYLYESFTLEQTLAVIAAFIEENPDFDVYWGTGYSVAIGGDPRGPRAEWLDEISADKPIILISNDEHNYWMNSIAFEMNGITSDTPVPAGGSIPVDPKTGKLWGTLTGASSLITMERKYTEAQQLEALARFQELMHQWGYTSVMCLVPHFIDASIYKAFYDSGELALRINLAGGRSGSGWDIGEVIDETLTWRDSLKNSELLSVSSIKFFADGVVEGMTAYLSEPYDAAAGLAPDFRGEPYWNAEELKEHFARTIAAGFQIYVHSIGDAATSEALNALEYAQNRNPGVDARSVLTHLQLVKDADKSRMGQLNIIGNTQPFWHIKAPGWFEVIELIALGEERALKMYPVKSLMDAGVTVTFSSDHPVTSINNPFWAIQAAVTRNLYAGEFFGVEDITDMDDPTWLLGPDERVSVKDAIEAYTINGAYQLFREHEVGSIAVGKRADFIIADRDIFDLNPIDISDTKVLATIFNGRVVYEVSPIVNSLTGRK